MVFTRDPQLPVPSGASRTHTKKQKFICLLFPAPIDETVSASNHSVLSFNLFFSFLFFQPSTSNRPADCALSHPISCAISTVALISRDCLNCFVSSSDSV